MLAGKLSSEILCLVVSGAAAVGWEARLASPRPLASGGESTSSGCSVFACDWLDPGGLWPDFKGITPLRGFFGCLEGGGRKPGDRFVTLASALLLPAKLLLFLRAMRALLARRRFM